jgi:hypothetical protein
MNIEKLVPISTQFFNLQLDQTERSLSQEHVPVCRLIFEYLEEKLPIYFPVNSAPEELRTLVNEKKIKLSEFKNVEVFSIPVDLSDEFFAFCVQK